MSKRAKPSTPTKAKPAGVVDTGTFSSPTRQQESKHLFTGEKAMEEDGQSLPSQEELQNKRMEERAAKKSALQKAVENFKLKRRRRVHASSRLISMMSQQ
jgi:hypothetical protein